ncbi:hypothetical protein DFJ74DRAFT_684067 [Hyaloraphidium curvatum]|nr:hypothetical protein DFJ74DRAFT_684067 [Hyaloraphidium curvatum]
MLALRLRAARLPVRAFSSASVAAAPKKPAEPEAPKTTVGYNQLPNTGVTYGSAGSGGVFGSREGAMEDQWVYQHDKELIQKMLDRMKQMEQALKDKGIDLPEAKKDSK